MSKLEESSKKLLLSCLPIRNSCPTQGEMKLEFINKCVADFFLARTWLKDLVGEGASKQAKHLGELAIAKQLISRASHSALSILTELLQQSANILEGGRS